jgi:hypothetical protein
MDALEKVNAVGGAVFDALMTANSLKLFLEKFSEPQKAKLYCGELADWDFEVQFNPSKFDLTRSVNWSESSEALSPWSTLVYAKGSPDQLSFELMFDQSVYRSTSLLSSMAGLLVSLNPLEIINSALLSDNDETVLKDIVGLYKLTMPIEVKTGNSGGYMRPPLVTFIWEQFQFVGVMENIQFAVTLFDDDGRPRRATANVTMKGRAMFPSTDPEDFFSPAYEPPAASSTTGDLSLGLFADPRLDILASLSEKSQSDSLL